MAKLCPICGSKKLTVDKSNIFLSAIGANVNYLCERCGNTFPFPIETEEKVTEARLDEKIMSATSTESVVPYGIFLVKVFYKIVGPIAVLVGLLLMLSGKIEGIGIAAGGAIALLIAWYAGKGK